MARVKNKLADKPTGLRHRQEAAAGFSTAGSKKAKAPNKWKLEARNKPYNIRNATRRSMFFCKGFKFRWEQPIFEKMLDGSFLTGPKPQAFMQAFMTDVFKACYYRRSESDYNLPEHLQSKESKKAFCDKIRRELLGENDLDKIDNQTFTRLIGTYIKARRLYLKRELQRCVYTRLEDDTEGDMTDYSHNSDRSNEPDELSYDNEVDPYVDSHMDWESKDVDEPEDTKVEKEEWMEYTPSRKEKGELVCAVDDWIEWLDVGRFKEKDMDLTLFDNMTF